MRRAHTLPGLIAAGLLFVSAGSYADFIENVTITGDGKIWESDGHYSPPGGLTSTDQTPFPPVPPANYDGHLRGTYANPGDNIELGILDTNTQFDAWEMGAPGTETVLMGTVAGLPVQLSSPTAADWRAGSYGLVKDYVNDFLNSIGEPDGSFTPMQLEAFVSLNLNTLNPALPEGSAAFRLSDPNVYFVSGSAGGSLNIGLAGTLDMTSFFQPLLDFFGTGITLMGPTPASEVVKVDWMGQSGYFYGFDCVDSHQDAGPTGNHAENSYSCTVPEPGTVVLFSLGLVGAGWARRRHAAQTRS